MWRWLLRWYWPRPNFHTGEPIQPHILAEGAITLAEIELAAGACEEPIGSNAGPCIDRYLMLQGKPKGAWCAIFASYCLMESWSRQRLTIMKLPLRKRRGAKKLAKTLVAEFGATWQKEPRRGDLAIYHRGRQVHGQWTWRGHVSIVQEVMEDGSYFTIGGNERNAVRRTFHMKDERKLVGFVRL